MNAKKYIYTYISEQDSILAKIVKRFGSNNVGRVENFLKKVMQADSFNIIPDPKHIKMLIAVLVK